MVNVLAPPGWTKFTLGAPSLADLKTVNDRINDRIVGQDRDAADAWRIVYGDSLRRDGACHDYAVTKRAELLGLGWPASKLLLAELWPVDDRPEDHMVLLVDTGASRVVLDNLRRDIVLWSESGYRARRVQSASDPDLWEAP